MTEEEIAEIWKKDGQRRERQASQDATWLFQKYNSRK